MNFHMGTATGMGGGVQLGGAQTGICGAGYCILTWIDVVSFWGLAGAFTTFGIGGAGGQP